VVWGRLLDLALQGLKLPGGWIQRLDDPHAALLARRGWTADASAPPALLREAGSGAVAACQIEDASADARLRAHPWVQGAPGLRFFLQQPLLDPQGQVWGVLCAFDVRTRSVDGSAWQMLAPWAQLAQALWSAGPPSMQRMASLIPAAIYQFCWQPGGHTSFPFASQAFGQLFGLKPQDLVASSGPFLDLLHPQDRDLMRHSIAASRATLAPWSLEFRCLAPSGHQEWFHGQSRPSLEADGSVLWHGFFINVSDRRKAEQELREAETRWKFALEGSAAGVWDWNIATGEHYFSPQYRQLYGYSEADDLFDSDGTQRVHPEDQPAALAARNAHFQGLTPLYRSEHRCLCRDGSWKWTLSRGLVVERDAQGRPLRMIGTHTDITERKQAEEENHRRAYFDALTGLPNRAQLSLRLSEWLERRPAAHSGVLIHVDLDGFKRLNHARGHGVGDALLRSVARRLGEELPPEAFLARLAADEFVAMLPLAGAGSMLAPREQALSLGDRMRVALLRPLPLQDHSFSITASVGVSVFPDPAQGLQDAEGLLREADAAMNHAKAMGANRVAAFEAGMQTEIENRFLIEEDLKTALARGELGVHVQAQYDAHDRVLGAELLMRWNHPVRGMVSPAEFIPVAETSGLIVPLGEWMLGQAAQALLALRSAGRHFPLSVNVSPAQFRQVDFVPRVQAILQSSGAPAGQLIFEITEGVLMDRSDSVQAQMEQLIALGIRFSIDDFGTGFSSLGYLKRLPIHEIKIDRSFVAGIPDDEGDAAIVRSVLLMARQFRLQVIAEGVENRRQQDFLFAHGCEGLQGYFLARPRPLQAWLDELAAQA